MNILIIEDDKDLCHAVSCSYSRKDTAWTAATTAVRLFSISDRVSTT